MPLDLFKLHDPVLDDGPRKWIMGNGKGLREAIGLLIEKLLAKGGTRVKLCRHLMGKYGICYSTAERNVYLKRRFYPLVFIEELLRLTNNVEERFVFQEKIDLLTTNQPPRTIVKAPKLLTENLCKIAGAHAADGTLYGSYFCISDGYKSNLEAFRSWLVKEFGLNYRVEKKSENEWLVRVTNKVFSRFLKQILGFSNGMKQYSVGEPEIIKNSNLEMRKAFALGALTFEAGVGMKRQVEFCVSSKKFQEDLCDILEKGGVRYHKMEKKSGTYWRFWSNALTKEETVKWMELFEPQTEKWLKLHEAVNGYHGKASSVQEAIESLDKVYPSKPASKVNLKQVLLAIKELKETHRYKLADYLAKEAGLKSFGGKWAHGLKHYLDILKQCNIIFVERRRFGKKKSFGTIVREVYTFNPKISEWRVPLRNQSAASDAQENPTTCFASSTA